jgi:putative membrane protein
MMFAMHASLFLAAVWFWLAVITEAARANWSPLAALLVTGKLFCLLGVLFTFAPRAIYGQAALLQLCFGAASPWPLLEDQQFAGLLMLAVCPVVYVGAAIVMARRWLSALDRSGGWSPGREAA